MLGMVRRTGSADFHYSIVTEAVCVYCAERAESLNIIQINLSFSRAKEVQKSQFESFNHPSTKDLVFVSPQISLMLSCNFTALFRFFYLCDFL